MMSDGKYYEIHQKRVWEVFAYDESTALELVMDGHGTLTEDELFVDKTSGVLDDSDS